MSGKFLLLGEVYVTDLMGVEITTLLGSCLSVCLYDLKNNIFGINHFQLPEKYKYSNIGNLVFGSFAIPRLVRNMLESGAEMNQLKAMVFGGSSDPQFLNRFSIGQKNIDFTINYLQQMCIPIVKIDIGGALGRRIVWNTDQINVRVDYLSKNYKSENPPGAN